MGGIKINTLRQSTKYLVVQKILKIFLSLCGYLYVGYILPLDEFANYSLHFAFTMLGLAIASGGVDEIATKTFMDIERPSIVEILGVKLFYFILFYFIYLIFFSKLQYPFYYILAVLVSIFSISHSKMESLGLGKYLSYYILFIGLTFFLIKILFLNKIENKVNFLGFILFLETLCGFLFPIYYLFKDENFLTCRRNLKLFLMETFPLWLSSVIYILYLRVDFYFINKYLSKDELAIYALYSRIVEQSFVLPSIVLSSAMALLVFNNKNKQRNEELIYCFAFYGGIFISLIVTVFCSIYLKYLGFFNKEVFFQIIVISLSIPFVSLKIANSKFMIIDNKQNYYLSRTIYCFLLNVPLTFLLGNMLGVLGVVVSTTLVFIFSGFFVDLLHPNTRMYFYKKYNSIFSTIYIKEMFKLLLPRRKF